MCFCRGLIFKALYKPKQALKEFNKARKEVAYADSSMAHMVDIFINPQKNVYFSFSDEMSSIKFNDSENIRGAETVVIDQKIKTTDKHAWDCTLGLLLAIGKQDCR